MRGRLVPKMKLVITLFIIMICFCADLSYTIFVMHFENLASNNMLNVTIDLVGSFICLVLYGTVMFDNRKTNETYHFLILIFFELLILNADATNWMIDGSQGKETLLMISNIELFAIILFIAYELWMVIQDDLDIPEDRRMIYNTVILGAMIVGTVDAIIDPLTSWIFYIDGAGYYQRGEYIILANLPMCVMIIATMVCVIRYGKSRRRKVAISMYAIVPIVAALLQLFYYGISFLYISLILTLLLVYGNYYVSRGTDLLKLDSELTEERFQVIYSQIQPHFLYNALTSIMNIKGNPQETVDAISDFGKFLRGNLDSISTKNPIPLTKELEHVEIYVDLEKRRFKEKLNVVYDIQDMGFFIPTLTMQMLVENAIKHGITMKEDGGTVTIRTYEDDAAHYIKVEDDGVGFDTDKPHDDEASHVGLKNLSNRLENLVNGRLSIESTVGVGTVAVVTVPKKKVNGHRDNPDDRRC